MFGFFKGVKEYKKLGMVMEMLNTAIGDSLARFEITQDEANLKEHILIGQFVFINSIMGRIEKFEWNLQGSIYVTFLPQKQVTLMEASSFIGSKLLLLSYSYDLEKEFEELNDKGELFKSIESHFTPQMRKLFLLDF